MRSHRVPDYNQLSTVYDNRYNQGGLEGVGAALLNMVHTLRARRILEVGCGTGRWLQAFVDSGVAAFGVDASTGMLGKAAAKPGLTLLAAAKANDLPFTGPRFDLIFCVNAVHHFDDPEMFIRGASSLLNPNGCLAIIGIDAASIRERYYYDYFEGVREQDAARYPAFDAVWNWMTASGLAPVELSVIDRSRSRFVGEEIFSDPFLKKQSNSTLALLSDEVYETGLRRIREAVESASATGQTVEFRSDLEFRMAAGFRRSANPGS